MIQLQKNNIFGVLFALAILLTNTTTVHADTTALQNITVSDTQATVNITLSPTDANASQVGIIAYTENYGYIGEYSGAQNNAQAHINMPLSAFTAGSGTYIFELYVDSVYKADAHLSISFDDSNNNDSEDGGNSDDNSGQDGNEDDNNDSNNDDSNNNQNSNGENIVMSTPVQYRGSDLNIEVTAYDLNYAYINTTHYALFADSELQIPINTTGLQENTQYIFEIYINGQYIRDFTRAITGSNNDNAGNNDNTDGNNGDNNTNTDAQMNIHFNSRHQTGSILISAQVYTTNYQQLGVYNTYTQANGVNTIAAIGFNPSDFSNPNANHIIEIYANGTFIMDSTTALSESIDIEEYIPPADGSSWDFENNNTYGSEGEHNSEAFVPRIGVENGVWIWDAPLSYLTDRFNIIVNQAVNNNFNVLYVDVRDLENIQDSAERAAYFTHLAEFVTLAHSKGIDVDVVIGENSLAQPDNRYRAFNYIDMISTYNTEHPNAKVRNLQYDIEVHTLPTYESQKYVELSRYVDFIDQSVTRVLNKGNLGLSIVIPHFLDSEQGWTPRVYLHGQLKYTYNHVLDSLNRLNESTIILMSYRDWFSGNKYGSTGVYDISRNEINQAANSSTNVIIAQEVGNVEPYFVTFFGQGITQYTNHLNTIDNFFKAYSGYAGTATHYMNRFLVL